MTVKLKTFTLICASLTALSLTACEQKNEKQNNQPGEQQAEQSTAATSPPAGTAETDPANPANAANTANPNGLAFPMDCTLGDDCLIARYVDRGARGDESATDYRCMGATQKNHKGVDIALRHLGMMETGVDVLAVADGTILRRRDGVADISARQLDDGDIDGKECGNGVVLRHTDGRESQYCHLKNGSLTVGEGASVKAGQKLGQVGLSGETEYPHLHYMLREGGEIIDPFDGQKMSDACTPTHEDDESQWTTTPTYEPLVLVGIRMSDAAPERADIWKAPNEKLRRTVPALVMTAHAFHARKGDVWAMKIKDPMGRTFAEKTETLDRDRQFIYRFIGRKRPSGGFTPGIWTAEIKASRDGMESKTLRTEFMVE